MWWPGNVIDFDLLVGLLLIGQEQDLGAFEASGLGLAFAGEIEQLLSFVVGEGNEVDFGHGVLVIETKIAQPSHPS